MSNDNRPLPSYPSGSSPNTDSSWQGPVAWETGIALASVIVLASVIGSLISYCRAANLSGVDYIDCQFNCFGLGVVGIGVSLFVLCTLGVRYALNKPVPYGGIWAIVIMLALVSAFVLCSLTFSFIMSV